jgi:hypothetical protein
MKCEACLNLLEEYGDDELLAHDTAQVGAHLITCARCANEFDTLGAEQEIYARYDRDLEVSPSLWHTVEAAIAPERAAIDGRTRLSLRKWAAGLFAAPAFGVSFAGALAVLIVAAIVGVAYLRTHRPAPAAEAIATVKNAVPGALPGNSDRVKEAPTLGPDGAGTVSQNPDQVKRPVTQALKSRLPPASMPAEAGQSDVLFSDVAFSAIEDQDTQRHIEQAQNLLRSVRNLQFSDDAEEIDVSYEKALSRRLLDENVVLRRDAEMNGKFPTKTLLSDLEPFLIDIANLPDKTGRDDLRVIKERVQKTEIVAALQGY